MPAKTKRQEAGIRKAPTRKTMKAATRGKIKKTREQGQVTLPAPSTCMSFSSTYEEAAAAAAPVPEANVATEVTEEDPAMDPDSRDCSGLSSRDSPTAIDEPKEKRMKTTTDLTEEQEEMMVEFIRENECLYTTRRPNLTRTGRRRNIYGQR